MGGAAAFFTATAAQALDWPQFGFDAQHRGNNTQEIVISKANVSQLHARYHVKLPSIADGAAALVQGVSTPLGGKDLLFLNTKDGRILALDAATGATVWSHRPATGPNYTTSSPALDPSRQFVYAYALDGKVHKYAVGDGTESLSGWPQVATLKPDVEKGSSALALATTSGGASFLYVANGGYPGDAGDYQGHVTSINLTTGIQNVFNANCSQLTCHLAENGSGDCSQAHPDCGHVQTAVWSRPGVVYSAELDRIFFSTGNGDYDANTGGHDWGDSVLALHSDGTGAGAGPVDAYTPTEFQLLQNEDADLGSTAPAVLPPVPGSNVPHLGVQSQKASSLGTKVRLLDLSNMSGAGGPGHVGGELQKLDLPQGGYVLSAPAVWTNPADGSVWIFYSDDAGLSAFRVNVDGTGKPSLATQWVHTVGGGTGSSPVLANDILYTANSTGLHALEPTTGGDLWTGSIGGVHWESPIVVNGRVYMTDEGACLWAFETVTPKQTKDTSDLNADGQSDVVLQATDGSVAAWIMNGSTLVSGVYISNQPVSGWAIRGVGDFNGDGATDLLWQATDGRLAVWYLSGTTIIGYRTFYDQPVSGWTVKGTADLNGDGWPDLIWQDTEGRLAVWYMSGTAIVGYGSINSQPVPGWSIQAVGDLNGDGRPDLVWQATDGRVAVWLLNGTLPVSYLYVSDQPIAGWTVVGSGDFNKDGHRDLVWQATDGRVAVWYMNSTSAIGYGQIYPQPLPGWTVAAVK
jgi:hypothetical protein